VEGAAPVNAHHLARDIGAAGEEHHRLSDVLRPAQSPEGDAGKPRQYTLKFWNSRKFPEILEILSCEREFLSMLPENLCFKTNASETMLASFKKRFWGFPRYQDCHQPL
jgi:hypothetical protein